jgi:hypothetical protein
MGGSICDEAIQTFVAVPDGFASPHTRHARACRGHLRLYGDKKDEDVDGRDKPGHDSYDNAAPGEQS